jgi:hypothetical protein
MALYGFAADGSPDGLGCGDGVSLMLWAADVRGDAS